MNRNILTTGAMVLLLACGDSTAAQNPSGSGGTSNNGGSGGTNAGGAANGGTGGKVDNACGAGCDIQCSPSNGTPSQGECIQLGGPIQCNPVTNAGCDTVTGEACDYGPGGFQCYPAPNDQQLCEACEPSGPFCAPGSSCSTDGVCAKFCCTNQDCGNGGTCETDAVFGVGVCVGGGTGGGGTGGSSTTSSTTGSSTSASSGGMGGMPTGGMGGMTTGVGGAGGAGGGV